MMMGIMMKATSDNIFRDKSAFNPNVIKKIHKGQIGQLMLDKFAELKDNEKVHHSKKIIRLFGCINLHKEDLDRYNKLSGRAGGWGNSTKVDGQTSDTYMPMYALHLPGRQLR